MRIDANASNDKFLLKTSNEPLLNGPIFPGLNPNVGGSDAEHFFLATIDDIDQKLIDRSRYSLIRAAGLLRQLLLDATPLVHEVNRNYSLKLQFECIECDSFPPLSPEAYWQNPDPTFFPHAQKTVVDLNTFLKFPCLEVNGQTATVRDLIRACANAKGGVHLGKTKSSEEEIVLDWDKGVLLLGEEPSLLAIAGTCRVILNGLSPLIVAITIHGSGSERSPGPKIRS